MKSFCTFMTLILTIGSASATVQAPPSLWWFSHSSSGATAANGEDWLYTIAQTADGGYLAGGYSEVQPDKHRAATFVLLDPDRSWPPVWEKVLDPGPSGEAVVFGVVETAVSWIGVGGFHVSGSPGQVMIVSVAKNNSANVQTQLFTPQQLGLGPNINAGAYSISRVIDSAGDHGFIVAGSAFDATPQHLPNSGFLLRLTPALTIDNTFGTGGVAFVKVVGSTANPPRTMCKRARVTHNGSGLVTGFVVAGSVPNVSVTTVSDGLFETFNLSGTALASRTFTPGGLAAVGPFNNAASSTRSSLCPQDVPTLNSSNIDIFDLAETANGDFVGLAQVNFASAFNPSNCVNTRLNGYSYIDMTAVLVRVTPSLTPLWAKEAGRFSGIDFDTALLPMSDGFAIVGNDALNPANVKVSVIKTNFSGDVTWSGGYLLPGDLNDCTFGAAATFDEGIVVAGNNDVNDEDYFALKIAPLTDLWVHDTPSDPGDEPNTAGGAMWASDDIWVRNQQDFYPFPNQHVQENPEYRDPLLQLPNYVYVAVQNRGTLPATGKVTAYFAKASTGLGWPIDWQATTLCCGKPCGGSLAPAVVVNLAPGATQIVETPWYPPNPADFASGACGLTSEQGHFCLLARIETAPIAPWGMTYPEFASVYANTAANNNIAWKNVTVVDNLPGAGKNSYGFVRNIFETPAAISLRFNMPRGVANPTLFDFATVDVTLDAELMRSWKAGGSFGAGLQQIGESTFRVSSGAHIDNIAMQGRQTQRFSVRITPPAGVAIPQLPSANLDVIQAESQNGAAPSIVGGMRFILQPAPVPKRRRAVLSGR